MAYYIDKNALVAEIERKWNICKKVVLDLITKENKDYYQGKAEAYKEILDLLDTLEVKEVQEEPAPTAYVITRCEEHSDYVEEVFFDEDKAQAYCDQFKGNENEYARHITKVGVTL